MLHFFILFPTKDPFSPGSDEILAGFARSPFSQFLHRRTPLNLLSAPERKKERSWDELQDTQQIP